MTVSGQIKQRLTRWLVGVSTRSGQGDGSAGAFASAVRNVHSLWRNTRDVEAMKLNIKNFGYELARQAASDRAQRSQLPSEPVRVGLASKPTTQRDMESEWLAYWCGRLRAQPIYHRKLWELCYVMQALWERGVLAEHKCGLGFGCGQEPLPSLMAAYGVRVTVTDLPPDQAAGRGWIETGQHTSELAKLHFPDIVPKDRFDSLVDLKYVDMNRIPDSLHGQYDFCWSVCAYEHLGSITNGLKFVRDAMKVLKPGGVAVHTTEFNFHNDERTVDNSPTVLFQRRHFQQLHAQLQSDGHAVAPLDFDLGEGPIDRYIDVPPYAWDSGPAASWFTSFAHRAHLKLSVLGVPCTCFALIVQKTAGARVA